MRLRLSTSRMRTIMENRETAKCTDAPRGARAPGVASMITFIAVLLVLGSWTSTKQTPTKGSAGPLRFTPASGPIEGNRFVFIDVEEPAAAIGTASIACQF